jgi:hypothetical protein
MNTQPVPLAPSPTVVSRRLPPRPPRATPSTTHRAPAQTRRGTSRSVLRVGRAAGLAVGWLLAGVVWAWGAERWQPLWDGKTFQGWHIIGRGTWKVEDGAIHGTHSAQEPEFSHLVTDRTFRDFTVRLKFKAVRGNSGFYFRIEEAGYSGVSGFQAEIDAERDVGGLYETNGRAWVVQPKPEDVQRYFKPGEWNEMTVRAHGGHLVVHVNGVKSAELQDDPGRREGKLALQLHGGQDCDVWFKDIELLVE